MGFMRLIGFIRFMGFVGFIGLIGVYRSLWCFTGFRVEAFAKVGLHCASETES